LLFVVVVVVVVVVISYGLDVNMDKVEDVLLHQKLLAMAKDPERRPVYHIRFLEVLPRFCSSHYQWLLILLILLNHMVS
jgi:hypothetical protein